MTKYEQKVRERAEEMAKENRTDRAKRDHPWSSLNAKSKETHINCLLPLARISLQREAEAYTSAYSIGRNMDTDPYSRAGLKTMLKSLGLVP